MPKIGQLKTFVLALATCAALLGLTVPARAHADYASEGGGDVSAAEELRLMQLAVKLDPLGNRKWRKRVPHGYKAPFGLQVHPRCFDFTAEAGIDRPTAEAHYRALVIRAFRMVTEDCTGRYPELLPYLREWVAQFRRMVVACTHKTQSDLGFGAQNLPLGLGLTMQLDKNERVGIDDGGPIASAPRMYRSNFIYPRDNFVDAVKDMGAGSDPFYVDTLVHETLHSTHANNREDHNKIEFIASEANGKCGDDIRQDRVNVVSTLCSRSALHGSVVSTPVEMFRLMANCGVSRCEKLFTTDMDDYLVGMVVGNWMPSQGLSHEQASSLCKSLYEEGGCRFHLAKRGKQITTDEIPELLAMGEKLRARVDALFPREPVLSFELLKANIDVEKFLEPWTSTECFGSVFFKNTGGYGVVGNVQSPSSTPRERWDATYAAALKKLMNYSLCAGDEKEKLRGLLDTLDSRVSEFLISGVYGSFVERRMSGLPEYSDSFAGVWGGARVRDFMGDKLMDEYASLLNRFHWTSPNFDCKAADLTAQRKVKYVPLPPAPSPQTVKKPIVSGEMLPGWTPLE